MTISSQCHLAFALYEMYLLSNISGVYSRYVPVTAPIALDPFVKEQFGFLLIGYTDSIL